MPEELLRFRNKYEKRIYDSEPQRESGSGEIEDFHIFISKLFENNGTEFIKFHNVISRNSKEETKKFAENCEDKDMKRWLNFYLL
jgi:hypothetical protein